MEAVLIQIFKYLRKYKVKIFKNYQRSDGNTVLILEPKKVTRTSGETVLWKAVSSKWKSKPHTTCIFNYFILFSTMRGEGTLQRKFSANEHFSEDFSTKSFSYWIFELTKVPAHEYFSLQKFRSRNVSADEHSTQSLTKGCRRLYVFGLRSVVSNLCLTNRVHGYRRYITKERYRMQEVRASHWLQPKVQWR